MEQKQILKKEILELINANGPNTTDINPNYLEFFEIEDLIEMRDTLKLHSENFTKDNNNYLDEIFSKCS